MTTSHKDVKTPTEFRSVGVVLFCSINWNLFNQDCFRNLMYQQSISYTLDSNHFQFDAEIS